MITFLNLAKTFDSVDMTKLFREFEMCGLRSVSLAHRVGLKVTLIRAYKLLLYVIPISDVQNVDYGVVPGGTLGSLGFL